LTSTASVGLNTTWLLVQGHESTLSEETGVRTVVMPIEKTKAHFFEPMLLLASGSLPEGDEWEYELKLDGYRAIAFKSQGRVQLRSRNNKDFALRYAAIATELENLPDETVIDGEVVAFDDSGRPSFNSLQNYGSSTAAIFYYVFDVLVLNGRDVRFEPLETRRELLSTKVLSKLQEPIRYSPDLDGSLPDLIRSVREQGFEGLVAKRRSSRYESGLRSGPGSRCE
jgi:ATP-dependent DNA ligase